jgi:hypothetical protein
MNPLSDADLQINQQAASVAMTVLSEPVEAATRCEQVTTDMAAEAAGVGKINRGMMRGMKAMGGLTAVGGMGKGLETGGLPNSFILAVTATQIAAIEDKREGGQLAPGAVLKSWPRQGFSAKVTAGFANAMQGVPDDRQELVLFLPIEGGNNKYLKAAAANTSAAGVGMPHKFAIGKDAPSQALVDKIVSKNAVPNVIIGGQSLQDIIAAQTAAAASAGVAMPGMPGMPGMPAAAVADPADQLAKLADLRDRGILTEEEFATQKAKILAG